jgi:hypothetical protein
VVTAVADRARFKRDALTRIALERRYGFPREVWSSARLDAYGLAADQRVDYTPSPWGTLGQVISPGDVLQDDVFLEYGSGMGVMVIAAARYPFRRVIGIDIVPEFNQIARRIVDRNRGRLRCQEVEIVTADVSEYVVPDDVTVAYMYNPFEGQIFDTAVNRLLASIDRNPRTVRLIYLNPKCAPSLLATGRARFVRDGRPASRTPEWRRVSLYELLPANP